MWGAKIRTSDRSLAGDIMAFEKVTYFILRLLANAFINFMEQAIKVIQASVRIQSFNQSVRWFKFFQVFVSNLYILWLCSWLNREIGHHLHMAIIQSDLLNRENGHHLHMAIPRRILIDSIQNVYVALNQSYPSDTTYNHNWPTRKPFGSWENHRPQALGQLGDIDSPNLNHSTR